MAYAPTSNARLPRVKSALRFLVLAPALCLAFLLLWPGELLFLFAGESIARITLWRLPMPEALALSDTLSVFAILCIALLPPAYAIAFAFRRSLSTVLTHAFWLAVSLSAVFLWSQSFLFAHFGALPVAALTIARYGTVMLRRPTRGLWACACFALVLAPLLTLLTAPPAPPAARKLWTVSLAVPTTSEYDAVHRLAFAGDRLAVLEGARLLFFNLQSGAVVSRAMDSQKGFIPPLYGTHEGNLLAFTGQRMLLLRHDGTLRKSEQAYTGGGAGELSPDGRAVAWYTSPGPPSPAALPPGITLFNTATLAHQRTLPYAGLEPTISAQTVFAEEFYPNRGKGGSYTLRNLDTGKPILSHEPCSEAHALSGTTILLLGCGEIRILDFEGRTIRRAPAHRSELAGIAQDGRSFVLVRSDARGDPAHTLYENFTVYSADTCRPLAEVRSQDLPERRSWSALSPDGKLLAVGSPSTLSMYRVP